MRRLTAVFLALVLAGLAAGCGGDKDRGVNRDRDRPRAAPTGDTGKGP
jgi:hypothetical protein